jgi:integrase
VSFVPIGSGHLLWAARTHVEVCARKLLGLSDHWITVSFFSSSAVLTPVMVNTTRCHAAGGELDQIQFLLGHVSVETTERYVGRKQRLRDAVNDKIRLAL